MNGAGHEVLARTCFPSEEHWDIQVCDTRDLGAELLDRIAVANEAHACSSTRTLGDAME